MKILFTFLTYGVNVFGGVEKSVYNLIQGLLKINVDAVVFTGNTFKENNNINHKIYYSDYLINDFNKSNINDAVLQNYKTYNMQIKKELLNIIKKEKPDYILAIDHIWGIIPYIDIFHDVTCPIGIVFHMLHRKHQIYKMFNFPFNYMFCVSNYVKDGLWKLGLKNRKFILLPNCISNEYFQNIKELSHNNIFCNARIAEGKGIQCLIDAFTKLLRLYPQCKLYLCNGNFHFMKKIDINSQIKGIDNPLHSDKIILLPNLKWCDISEVLHQMDLVILPTEMETFGLGALETIASRLPLITTKVGNLPDLLKDSAFYIDKISSDKIVETIIKVFTEKELVSEKLEIGYQIARDYLDTKIASELVNHLLN